jgi:lactate dehydrogenase-like 2-hydroxyacid dehydrogenase
MDKTILVLGGLLQAEIASLEQDFKILRLSHESDPDRALRKSQNNIVGIAASPSYPVKEHLISLFPNLEIISQSGVGYDSIDIKAAAKRSIVVTNTPDLVTNDTADTAIILMLNVARRAVEADMFVRVGKWQGGAMPLGTSLTAKTVGIIGLGRIGQAIARRAAGFDMNVVYHGRTEKPDQPYEYFKNLEEMASHVDFLVCACTGGPETRGLVHSGVLQSMKPESFLINVARGSVVDEQALLIALENKIIAGAGLDVYDNEPYVPEALLKRDNVVLLPHIGTATFETRTKMGQLVVENIRAHFDGKPLLTPVAC